MVIVMPTTYELKIYGRVQHVGFRDRIENIGKGLGINGIIYNHKDGTVRILVNFDDEEDKELFKKYIERLEKKDKLIEIEKIEEKRLNTYIEFPEGISRLSSDDILELNKKLDEGVKYIKLIFAELEEHKKVLLEIKDMQSKTIEILNGHTKILNEIKDTLKEIKDKL